MGNKIPGVQLLRKRIDQGSPLWAATQKTASDYYHEQFTESSNSARFSKWDDDKTWSSQEWKADKSMDDRTGQPVVTSW